MRKVEIDLFENKTLRILSTLEKKSLILLSNVFMWDDIINLDLCICPNSNGETLHHANSLSHNLLVQAEENSASCHTIKGALGYVNLHSVSSGS